MKLWKQSKEKESQVIPEDSKQQGDELMEELLTDTLNLGWYWSENKQEFQMAI